MAAFISATGSAGTIGAGDYLKEQFGAKVVVAEALQCPTLLLNGFGAHNIQGILLLLRPRSSFSPFPFPHSAARCTLLSPIPTTPTSTSPFPSLHCSPPPPSRSPPSPGIGDKHVPLIHNVTNLDAVAAIDDEATDKLLILFNTPAGHAELLKRGVPQATIDRLKLLGVSAICNILASIKTAKHFNTNANQVIFTVATGTISPFGARRRGCKDERRRGGERRGEEKRRGQRWRGEEERMR